MSSGILTLKDVFLYTSCPTDPFTTPTIDPSLGCSDIMYKLFTESPDKKFKENEIVWIYYLQKPVHLIKFYDTDPIITRLSLNVLNASILYKLSSCEYKDFTISPSNAIPTKHPSSYNDSDIV